MTVSKAARRANAVEPPDQETMNTAEATAAPSPLALAEARQRDYARSRRDWAEAVGRPYANKSDPRPPPGELDAVADE
jgi:hypothetical protein